MIWCLGFALINARERESGKGESRGERKKQGGEGDGEEKREKTVGKKKEKLSTLSLLVTYKLYFKRLIILCIHTHAHIYVERDVEMLFY